jgi:deoxycytidine triphosphate deaminase
MSTLSKQELLECLARSDEKKLVVTPLLDRDLQINQIGIDLRLSNQFDNVNSLSHISG